VNTAPDRTQPFDAIVVGGGTAGCTVAAVLAGEHGLRVALVERGPIGDMAAPVDPFPAISAGRGVDQIAVVDGRGNHSGHCLQAARLGGGSALNGLIAELPDEADLGRWVGEHGCSGWSHDELATTIAATRQALPTMAAPAGVLGEALRAAAPAARPADLSLRADATSAVRRSSALDLLDGPIRNGTVTIIEAEVTHLVAAPSGVIVEAGGRRLHSRAGVLCAGALRTPQVLGASGVDHPALGRGLMNHIGVMLPIDRGPDGAPGGTAPVSALCDVNDEDGRLGQIIAFEHIDASRRWAGLAAVLLRTDTRGHLGGVAGATAAVTMPLGPGDVGGLASVARATIELVAGGVAHGVGAPDSELVGLADLPSGEFEQWLGRNVWHLSHPVGTCAMGSTGVTDERGRVRGLDSVWVADASVMPRLVTAHPNMTVALVARRIAGFVAEELS